MIDPATAAHEAGHAIALMHYFGRIAHDAQVTPNDRSLGRVTYQDPLKSSTNHQDGYSIAVVAVAGRAAERAKGHGTHPLGPGDALSLELAWRHYQKHWRAPRVSLPAAAHFLASTNTEAHALMTRYSADLNELSETFMSGAGLPDKYLAPEVVELRDLERQREALKAQQAEHAAARPSTPWEVKDAVTGFARPSVGNTVAAGQALAFALSGRTLNRARRAP